MNAGHDDLVEQWGAIQGGLASGVESEGMKHFNFALLAMLLAGCSNVRILPPERSSVPVVGGPRMAPAPHSTLEEGLSLTREQVTMSGVYIGMAQSDAEALLKPGGGVQATYANGHVTNLSGSSVVANGVVITGATSAAAMDAALGHPFLVHATAGDSIRRYKGHGMEVSLMPGSPRFPGDNPLVVFVNSQ